jgi:hypothetical protein
LCRQPELQALVCLWYGLESITIVWKCRECIVEF